MVRLLSNYRPESEHSNYVNTDASRRSPGRSGMRSGV